MPFWQQPSEVADSGRTGHECNFLLDNEFRFNVFWMRRLARKLPSFLYPLVGRCERGFRRGAWGAQTEVMGLQRFCLLA